MVQPAPPWRGIVCVWTPALRLARKTLSSPEEDLIMEMTLLNVHDFNRGLRQSYVNTEK